MSDRRNDFPRSLRGANPRPREDVHPNAERPDRLPPPTGYEHPQGRSGVGIEKEIPVRSRTYREYVSKLPCAWCGTRGPSEPSHHGAHGTSSKTDDLRCIPLCARCHRGEYHRTMRLGAMTAEDTKAWANEMIIRTLIGWYRLHGVT